MPYNSGTGAYERRATTVIDATPDGDTVAVAIDVKLDQGIDDYVVDLNHHSLNGRHYPATSTHTDSRFLDQSPAGVVSWKDGVPAPDAALKDFSNVASGAIPNAKLANEPALKDFSNVADGAVPIEKLESGILPAQIAGTAYVKTNILGTVSQSGGVPAGAIIEQGSNANGRYVRFADGTQVCYSRYGATIPAVSAEGIHEVSITLPASFVNTEWVHFVQFQETTAPTTNIDVFSGRRTSATSSGCKISYRPLAATLAGNIEFNMGAFGRWF